MKVFGSLKTFLFLTKAYELVSIFYLRSVK